MKGEFQELVLTVGLITEVADSYRYRPFSQAHNVHCTPFSKI